MHHKDIGLKNPGGSDTQFKKVECMVKESTGGKVFAFHMADPG